MTSCKRLCPLALCAFCAAAGGPTAAACSDSCEGSEPMQLLQRESREFVSKSASNNAPDVSMSSLPSSRLAVQSVSADAEPTAVSVVEAQPDEIQPMRMAITEATDALPAASMSNSPVISGSVDNADARDISVAESFSVFTAASPRRTSSLPKTSAAADQTDATAEKSWPLPLTQLVEAQHSAVHTLRGHIFPKEPGGMFFLAIFAVVVAFVLATIALMDNNGSFQAVTDKVEATAGAQVAAQVNPMLAVRGGELGLAGASKARGTSNGASAVEAKIIKLSDCGS